MEKIGRAAWKKAWITNDFIFGNVMQEGDNCLNLLQAILPELNLQRVRLNTQKDIHDHHQQRGVRLDVFAEDSLHRVYNIEMQVRNRPGLGQRIRYYQSKIDMDSLRSGVDYQNIKPSYIIFLCPFDPCGADLRRYTFRLRCDEQPRIYTKDGRTGSFTEFEGQDWPS